LKLRVMKSLLVHRLWIVGALAGIVVISGAVRIAAGAGHGPVHLVVASNTSPVAQHQAEPQVEPTPTAQPAVVENEAAEEANEPAEAANNPAEEANEPAENENENENARPTPAPTAPPAPATSSTKTFSLVGGTVMVTCTGNAITLDSATPNAGFTTDKAESQEGSVEVRFESDSHESRLQVSCRNGAVVVEELREENS
jgi:outer membrane biosynthesis protein TonB